MRWKLFLEDEQTGKRTFLGEMQAATQADALDLGAQYFEYDAGDLVAIQMVRCPHCQTWHTVDHISTCPQHEQE